MVGVAEGVSEAKVGVLCAVDGSGDVGEDEVSLGTSEPSAGRAVLDPSFRPVAELVSVEEKETGSDMLSVTLDMVEEKCERLTRSTETRQKGVGRAS